MQFFRCLDALKIHVQHQRPVRVHLNLTENHLLGSRIGLEINDRGVERLFFKTVHHLVVIQGDGLIILACPIYDRRDMAVTTLSSARTRTENIARLGVEYIVAAHYRFSLTVRPLTPLIP